MQEKLPGSVGNHMSDCHLCKYVEKHLALHHFALWHDHSSVCGCGCWYTLVTLKEVYNSAMHYTNAEQGRP